MKYFGFGGGWLVENFAILPGISYNWMRTNKTGLCWSLQFAWLWWYFDFGTIRKKLKETRYY